MSLSSNLQFSLVCVTPLPKKDSGGSVARAGSLRQRTLEETALLCGKIKLFRRLLPFSCKSDEDTGDAHRRNPLDQVPQSGRSAPADLHNPRRSK